ncbi:hypothetical protein BH20ACI4_BH20ACI4_28180 [soil metagenome]
MNNITIFGFPAWYEKLKKIELLKSTLDSVVKIYGQPVEPKGDVVRKFETPEGNLNISLSTGKCGTEYKKGYDVDAGIVERITFFVKEKFRVKPKKLGFDLSKFEKFEVRDVPGIYTYENSDDGIFFGTDKRGLVDELDFQPASEFDDLYCK